MIVTKITLPIWKEEIVNKSCQNGRLVFIGLFVTVAFFAGNLGLGPRAEAAAKSEPVAVIVGPDFQVSVGRTITVDGRLSYDPSGRKLHFNWELAEAPPDSSANITKKNSATPSFTPDKHGRYVIELTVHNGIKSSDSVSITLTTTYANYDLIPVDTRVQNTPQGDYGIQVGTNTYWPPAYYSGTGTATATGFQVLVLDRSSLLPAQTLQSGYTYNQSFGGNQQGYSAMTTFLETLSDTGLLVIISSIDDNSALDTYSGKSDLTTQIKNLGGTDDFASLGAAGWSPYSLIGIPGLKAGNGFEMYGPKQRDPSSQTIQGLVTKDKYGKFQFIYPDFTQFETKSGANPDGSYSGSIKVGDQEIQAAIPGGRFQAGQGGFQVAYLMRENLDWETIPMEYELNPMVYQTNVPGQESRAMTKLISDLKTAAFWKTYSWPQPDSLIVIIQSIGVPFGATSLYDPQSIKDLEKVINNLGGTESTFHAIFKNPGTAAGPNKYSLLGIAVNGMDPMPTKPRLGPTESLEASTLKLQSDGSWSTQANLDGNVRGLLNKNNQGMYVSFFASEGVPDVDLSLPLILFQDPTPWITSDAGKDPTPYMAAYSWISTYITGAPPQIQNGACSAPGATILKGGKCGDLRTYYPTMDNDWSSVWTILYSNDGDMDIQVNKFCQSATGQGTDFNCAQYQWMKGQLRTEMSYVKAAKSLFHDDILQFLTDLTLTESSTLNSFYTTAYTTLGIDPTKANTTQNILNMVDAVARQAQIMGCMSAKPAVVVVASIVNLGLGIASRFIPDSEANPVAGDVSSTIQDLWQEISENYLKETFVARKSYELVASDWGKLQAAENLYQKWDEDSRDLALTTMTVGFEAYFYKVLIPTAYTRLERIPGTQYSSPGDVEICDQTITGKCVVISTHAPDVPLPDYVALASQAWDPFLAREATDLYWVYKGDHYTKEFIPGSTLNDLFAPFDYTDTNKLGVSRVDFFTRWPFGDDYYDCSYYHCDSTGTLCYTCVDGKIPWCF